MLLNALQIIVSIILIGLILLQERSSGGGIFSSESFAPYHARRGLEKIIFALTIITAVIFAGLAVLNIVYKA